MPNAVGHSTLDEFREQLARLAGQLDASFPPAFTRALRAFLTAMAYNDSALMRSYLNEALGAFRDVVREAIQKRLGWPGLVREACRKARELLRGHPSENFDEVGNEIKSSFDKMLKDLAGLRDGPVKLLQEDGHEVENAASLEHDIAELQELQHGILENWPWSDQPLPPVDRNMVARSRAAIARGEGEPIEDLLRRLGGTANHEGR